MNKLCTLLVMFFIASVVLSACGSTPEVFTIRGTQIEGIVTVVSQERIEFEGRVIGGPNTSFWLFSQEEGVGEGSPNWMPMNCTVSTFDTTGNAYVTCFANVDKKHRQNAIVLSTSADAIGRLERIEYRPNLIIGRDENFADIDYQRSQGGMEPLDIKNTMAIYRTFSLEMPINADYNQYPLASSDFDLIYAPSRGFYLTFVTKNVCDGGFFENHVNLYHWNESSWKLVQSIRLEDVDFSYESGEHDFNVEGYTVRLTYSHHYKCRRQYEYIEIP